MNRTLCHGCNKLNWETMKYKMNKLNDNMCLHMNLLERLEVFNMMHHNVMMKNNLKWRLYHL